MNWLDISIILVVLILAVFGFRNGVIRSLSTVAGMVAGTWIAKQYYEPLSETLSPLINNTTAANIASFVLLFLLILVSASIVGMFVRKVVSLVFLGWLDTLVGGVLGFAVGVVLAGIVLSLLGSTNTPGLSSAIKDSAIAPLITARMPFIMDLLPQQFDIRGLLPP